MFSLPSQQDLIALICAADDLKPVCESLSQTPLILLGVFVITAWSVCSLCCLIVRYIILRWRLSKLRRGIGKASLGRVVIDETGVVEIKKLFARDKLLTSTWEEFEETLLYETGDDGAKRVFNTRAAGEFLTRETVIESALNLHFHSAFPPAQPK